MAMTRMMRRAGALILGLALAGCGTDGNQSSLTQLTTAIASQIGNRGGDTNLTATRASLQAAGFSDPLIVISLPEAGTRGGLLKGTQKNGVTFWIAVDGGSTVMLDGAVVRGTTGLGYDLYSVDTKEAQKAISRGQSGFYPRTYRYLAGDGNLRVLSYACRMDPEEHETITVFDRAHATLRFQEICVAQAPEVTGLKREVVNTYWRDARGPTVWRAQQWIGPELGYLTLERVFK